MSSTVLRCSLGDLPIMGGMLRLPLRGNWVAHLETTAAAAPAEGSAATLLAFKEDGSSTSFVGTVRRSGIIEGSQTVTVVLVGGAGNLLDDVAPCDHVAGSHNVPAGLVARAIADAAGEKLAAGVEDALDAFVLPRWTRIQMSARNAFDVLADRLGVGWRVLIDGTIWFGADLFPAATGVVPYVGGDPDDGTSSYAPDGTPFVPGTTINGVEAVEITYVITSGSVRAQVREQVPGDPRRRPALDLYRATYAATVKGQNGDGTLDLTADDARVGDLLSVPFRCGVVGAKIQIPANSRVRVAFESADPRGTYSHAIDQDRDAAKAVHRVGDTGSAGQLIITTSLLLGPTAFAVAYVPPGGVPGAPVTVSLGVDAPPLTIDFDTKAETGSSEVFLR